ncbi:uncharacterized protein LOC144640553 [Oculina patagonica]
MSSVQRKKPSTNLLKSIFVSLSALLVTCPGGKCDPDSDPFCPITPCIAPGCTHDCDCGIYSPTLENPYAIFCDERNIQNLTSEFMKGISNKTRGLALNYNKIETIPNGTFAGLPQLILLDLTGNRLRELHKGAFDGLYSLEKLDLYSNGLRYIEEGTFQDLENLVFLMAFDNKLREIQRGTFAGLRGLVLLYLEENEKETIEEGSFLNVPGIENIKLKSNKLQRVAKGSLDGLRGLYSLELSYNRISFIEDAAFKDLTNMVYLELSSNSLTKIGAKTFEGLNSTTFINLANNTINQIDDEAFKDLYSLKYVTVHLNQLQVIPAAQHYAPRNLSLIFTPSDQPPVLTIFGDIYLQIPLIEGGFVCNIPDNAFDRIQLICKLCPPGTYSSYFSCLVCPAGGFYQDIMGYVGDSISHGMGCKECPPGRFVPPDAAPGKAVTECKSCPKGTQYNRHAGFRACHCIEGFFRLNRFEGCLPCPSNGLKCVNESLHLKAGFFWKWESKNNMLVYHNFTKELQIESDWYDRENSKYHLAIPAVYKCPVGESCLGGMEAKCSEGYTGILCAVCSEGYYKMISNCQKCPSLPWLVGQIFLVAFIVAVIAFSLLLGRKSKNASGRSMTDIFLARLKIFIGFYQVTSATLDGFSYIKWPVPFLKLVSYAKILQLNLLQIVPPSCIKNNIQVSSYTTLIFFVVFNASVIVVACLYFQLRKLYIIRKNNTTSNDIHDFVASTKEVCFRNTFLLLFIVYPTTSTRIFQMLPAACHDICVDSRGSNCKSYLRSDYSLECFTDKYQRFFILNCALILYVVGVPIITLLLLYRYHYLPPLDENDTDRQIGMTSGLSFLYENYSSNCWFWEVLELARKIILTSVIVFIGGESRTNLGVAAIMSGLYTVLFASYQPISDRFEHWLQLMSLLATCANMNVGILLKIPEENITGIKTEIEAVAVTVLLVFVNLMVTVMMIVRYLVDFYQFAQNLKKNPKTRCSLSCCLTIITFASTAQDGIADGEIERDVTQQIDVEQGPSMNCTFEDLSILELQDSKADNYKNTKDVLSPELKSSILEWH